jgi:hypothetical protein
MYHFSLETIGSEAQSPSYLVGIGLDVRGSVHHSTILTVKNQQDARVYQNFIIPYFK